MSVKTRVKRLIFRDALLVLISGALLWTGCSKNSASDSAAASSPRSFNLGTLELASDVANRQDLGNGQVCVVTAHAMGAQNLQLVASLEKEGKKIASTRTGPVPSGAPLEISFGDVRVQFTPQIK
jgi:hypothetical protein